MCRRYEKFLHRARKFTSEQWTHNIRICVRNHSHSDKSRHEKSRIRNSSREWDTRSHNTTKDDKIQRLIEDRWYNCLCPYTKYTGQLTTYDRLKNNILCVHNYPRWEKRASKRFFSGRIPVTRHSWISRIRSACMRENFGSIVTR